MTKNTVLIVDDEPNVRGFVRRVLLRQGCEILEAKDGIEALELLKRVFGGIQLRITDLDMPRMDGVTLGQKVNADFPDVAVLYMSGIVRGSDMGVANDHFLSKPFRADALIHRVQGLCA